MATRRKMRGVGNPDAEVINLVTRKKVRASKQGTERIIKEKFIEERQSLPPITAKTKKQKEYLAMLNDPNIQIVICLGLHGTGKTYVAAATAADKFRKGELQKIIVSRAYVQTGKTSGLKPGTTLQKMYPYVRNVLDTIKSRIGNGPYEIALRDGESGQIEVQEVESIRGRSFDEDSFLIIDEGQQTTPEEMKSIVTRISDNCKLVICGDENQKDIRGESGLKWFMDFVNRHHIKGVGVINFSDPEDIIRGGMVKQIAIGMMKDAENKKEKFH